MTAPRTRLRAASPPSATPTARCCTPTVDGSDDAPVTVVLAHGWTLAQAAWDDVAELLAPAGRRRRAAAGPLRPARARPLDLGPRRAPTSPSTSSATTSASCSTQLAPTGPVVLGGHSMGGMTIMCLAAARPELFGDRVRGVALVSTSAGDLDLGPAQPAAGGCARLTPGMLNARPRRARGVVERLRAAAAADAPAAPEDGPRACSTAPTRPTRWCGRGGDHARLDRARRSSRSCPALGDHDKRERARRAHRACRWRSWSATATS